jgi:hypothetical protein
MESTSAHPPKPTPPTVALSKITASYLQGFINLATMTPWLRRIAVAGFVILGIIAAALAISQLPQPLVPSPDVVNGQTTETTVVELFVFVIATFLGIAAALAGALQMRWLPRTAAIVLIVFLLGIEPFLDWRNSNFVGSTEGLSDAVSVLQLVLLVGLLVWASGPIRRWRSGLRAGSGTATKPANERFMVVFIAALAIVFVYYGLYVFKWGAWLVAEPGVAQRSTNLLILDLIVPTVFFPLIGSLFIYMFTTSSLDWALSLGGGAAALASRIASWLFPLGAGIIACVELVVAARRIQDNPLPPLIVTGIFGVTVTLVLLLGPPARQWTGTVPLLAVVAGVLTLFGVLDLPIDVAGFLAPVRGFSTNVTSSLTGILIVADSLVAVFGGLALAALGRIRRSGVLAFTGLTMILVALFFTIANIDLIQADLGINLPPQPQHIISSLLILPSLAIPGSLVWLAVTRRPLSSWPGALTGPFIALVGVQAADWYSTALQNRDSSAPSGVLVTAGIFLVLNVWGLLRSGASGTNGDSPGAPRASRVLLYFGYTLLTAATFLYAMGLRAVGTGDPIQDPIQAGDATLLTALALYILCIPLALVTGLGRSLSWSALHQAPGLPEQPVHPLRERLTLVLILVVGMLLLAGLWIYAVRFLLPLATSQ